MFLDVEEVVYPRKVCGVQGFVFFVGQRNKVALDTLSRIQTPLH